MNIFTRVSLYHIMSRQRLVFLLRLFKQIKQLWSGLNTPPNCTTERIYLIFRYTQNQVWSQDCFRDGDETVVVYNNKAFSWWRQRGLQSATLSRYRQHCCYKVPNGRNDEAIAGYNDNGNSNENITFHKGRCGGHNSLLCYPFGSEKVSCK